MHASFELFDHTADLGVRVRAATRAGLVAPATDGLYAAIGRIVTAGPAAPWAFELTGRDAAELLRDYLADVLRLFERDHVRVCEPAVREYSDARLAVVGRVAGVDRAASELEREIKAVTYHELAVREVPGGWEAMFIVDI